MFLGAFPSISDGHCQYLEIILLLELLSRQCFPLSYLTPGRALPISWLSGLVPFYFPFWRISLVSTVRAPSRKSKTAIVPQFVQFLNFLWPEIPFVPFYRTHNLYGMPNATLCVRLSSWLLQSVVFSVTHSAIILKSNVFCPSHFWIDVWVFNCRYFSRQSNNWAVTDSVFLARVQCTVEPSHGSTVPEVSHRKCLPLIFIIGRFPCQSML